ncbi:MAG: transposase [Proteobacteria bacterium]|nr:transposase [Pseudomonadota bacterium]
MGRKRRRFKAAEKVAILKRHLVEKQDVSAICEELKLHPKLYEWQRQFFENGVKAFEKGEQRTETRQRAEIVRLNEKIQRKDSVLSQLMEEHHCSKKSLGEA